MQDDDGRLVEAIARAMAAMSGENNHSAKINAEIAAQIRATAGIARLVAQQFGLSETSIRYIKQGKRWR